MEKKNMILCDLQEKHHVLYSILKMIWQRVKMGQIGLAILGF
jgi:hypothetical protein